MGASGADSGRIPTTSSVPCVFACASLSSSLQLPGDARAWPVGYSQSGRRAGCYAVCPYPMGMNAPRKGYDANVL